MHWATYYNEYGDSWDPDAYSIDLTKEIIPELRNNMLLRMRIPFMRMIIIVFTS